MPHHRADRIIGKSVKGSSDVSADYQYRCAVYHQPPFYPGVQLFENLITYRKKKSKFPNFISSLGARISSSEEIISTYLRNHSSYSPNGQPNSFIMVKNYS